MKPENSPSLTLTFVFLIISIFIFKNIDSNAYGAQLAEMGFFILFSYFSFSFLVQTRTVYASAKYRAVSQIEVSQIEPKNLLIVHQEDDLIYYISKQDLENNLTSTDYTHNITWFSTIAVGPAEWKTPYNLDEFATELKIKTSPKDKKLTARLLAWKIKYNISEESIKIIDKGYLTECDQYISKQNFESINLNKNLFYKNFINIINDYLSQELKVKKASSVDVIEHIGKHMEKTLPEQLYNSLIIDIGNISKDPDPQIEIKGFLEEILREILEKLLQENEIPQSDTYYSEKYYANQELDEDTPHILISKQLKTKQERLNIEQLKSNMKQPNPNIEQPIPNIEQPNPNKKQPSPKTTQPERYSEQIARHKERTNNKKINKDRYNRKFK